MPPQVMIGLIEISNLEMIESDCVNVQNSACTTQAAVLGCTASYPTLPARTYVKNLKNWTLPERQNHSNPVFPILAPDGGCDVKVVGNCAETYACCVSAVVASSCKHCR